MIEIPQPASVTITQLIINSLPVSGPLLMGIVVQAIIQLRSNSRARTEAAEAKALAMKTASAVDGQMTDFRLALADKVGLQVKVASMEGNKAGSEEGQAKAEAVAADKADAVAIARALPPDPGANQG